MRVQKTIEVNLRALYPKLNIQGEESKESIADIDSALNPDAITEAHRKFITQEFLNGKHTERLELIKDKLRQSYGEDEISSELFESFSTKDAVVWIDPLDGTSDFVKENYPAVTVLIGLSIKGHSRIGVVHNPFSEEDETIGKTLFGTGEHGAFKLHYDQKMTEEELAGRSINYLEPFDSSEEVDESQKIKVAASLSHFSDTMEEIIEKGDPVEIVRLGGAGNKCCHISLGTVDAYIHPSPGLKYWDLCAPESLVKAMGGYATDLNGERFGYSLEGDRKLRGLVLARSPPMYNQVMQRIGADYLKTVLKSIKL